MAIGKDLAAVPLASEPRGIDALRLKAKTDPKGAIKETARQFEALLMNSMLKSMRETVAKDGMFDSEQTRLYTSMLDEQLSQSMAKRGIGIAEVLARQLTPAAQAASSAGTTPGAKGIAPPPSLQSTPPFAGLPQTPVIPSRDTNARAGAFIDSMAADAQAISRETGIPARFLIGHAALETGWGSSEIRAADGTPSHNLFGIKAGADWRGRTVDVLTTEYAGGVAQKKVETFRAYDSYRDSFRDYADLLANSPRYAGALKNTGDARAYAQGLQDAGYATDPRYADKLSSVIDGKSLRLSKLA